MPCVSEVDEKEEHKSLHGLQRLVAGAIQEWELVQQPDHAALCTKLNGVLVWQGRGYVSPIACAISLHQLPFQGKFEKISAALQLVMPKPFYKFIILPISIYC